MNKILDELSEVVAKANDLFYQKHDSIDTLMGIMDKTLRAQGMKADAITIDCVKLDKKVVLLIHDEKPDRVSIALGNKNGDIFSSSEYALTDVTENLVLGIMEMNFVE